MSTPAAIAGMGLTLLGGQGEARAAKALGESEAQMALYQQAVARNNAVIAGYNADYAAAAGDVVSQSQQQKSISAAGETRAALADKGVDINSGSAAGVQESQATLAQIDAANIRNQVLKNVWNFKTQQTDAEAQAGLFGMKAQYSRMAAKYKAKSSLIGSYSSFAGQVVKFGESFAKAASGGGG